LLAALVDGQEAVLDGQGEDGHGGAVVGAEPDVVGVTAPAAVLALLAQQEVAEPRLVGAPVVVAELEHGLGAVVDGVEEVPLVVGGGVAQQPAAGLEGLGAVVAALAAQLQGQDAGAGAGGRDRAGGLVAEAAGGVLAALDVLQGAVDGLGWHVAAEVAGGPQGQHLPAGHAHVAAVVVGDGVAPAAAVGALGPLGLEDDG